MDLPISLAALLLAVPQASVEEGLRVFVLAGQSNMVGHARNSLFEVQAEAEETREHFTHLRRDGEWVVREDVFLKFFDRRGGLTLGYGAGGRTGIELEFGTVVGDALREPVLLIKTAWGGHALYRRFRPPSAGLPEERVEADLAKAVERTEKRNEETGSDEPLPTLEDVRELYGASYRAMIAEVRTTLERLDELFPELRGRVPELAGFVWFQGWNDQYEGGETEYASNLGHLVKDVRRDLGAPELPFVIGVMGQNMSRPAHGPMRVIQEAQLSMEELFPESVRAVRTDVLVDAAAEALYPAWRDNEEEWARTGSDHPYHYLGSAIWFQRMGRAFGEAMLELLE